MASVARSISRGGESLTLANEALEGRKYDEAIAHFGRSLEDFSTIDPLYKDGRINKQNALNRARAIGRDDVRHYAGGMNGWRSRGGDVTL